MKDGKTYKHQTRSEPHHKVLRAVCLTDLKCRKTILAFIANQFIQQNPDDILFLIINTTKHTRSVRKVSDRIFLCEHLMDYNLARLHEPTLNLSAHA